MSARPVIALLSIAMSVVLVAPATAAPASQPAGAVANPPDGPAQAWLVANLDSGQILGGREPYSSHAPASTIKALLAMVVLDQLPLTPRSARPARTPKSNARASAWFRVRSTPRAKYSTGCFRYRVTTPPTLGSSLVHPIRRQGRELTVGTLGAVGAAG